MKILKRDEFKQLLENNPGKKFIFFEYEPDVFKSQMHITEGDPKYPTFGAWAPCPCGTGFSNNEWEDYYDWNLNEYNANDMFAVLEESELNFLEQIIADANL